MNDEELRSHLERMDPMHPGVPMEPVTSESSRRRLEHIMSTPTIETREAKPRSSRTVWFAAAAAVLVAAVAIGGIALNRSDDPEVVAGPPLELTAGPHDALASCLQFDVSTLAMMPVAFEGTVVAVEGEAVTLDVDRWFAGGNAEQVRVTAPAGLEALIGGIAFEQGGSYLITATDGTVNYCGYSGPATPEFRQAFEEAFPG